jgi:hypothetical protein
VEDAAVAAGITARRVYRNAEVGSLHISETRRTPVDLHYILADRATREVLTHTRNSGTYMKH